MRDALHLIVFGPGQGESTPFGFIYFTLGIAPLVLFAIAVGMLVLSFVIMSFLTPKPETPKPAALDDWDFPQFEDGTPQCVIFGEGWCEGPMICHYGNYRTSKIKADGGKK